MINFLSYNGGTWNLALRFISTAGGPQARKAALLSAGLYFIWPLILFVPMWLAPVLLPNLSDPQTSYAELVHLLMPAGLVGLILASMFSNTMTMTASDSNAVSAVITRDIVPWLRPDLRNLPAQQSMILARTVTFTFTICTLVIAWNAGAFGGVLGLIIAWFGALLGPIAIPVLFGLLPAFRHCGQTAAIAAILGGLLAFALAKTVFAASLPVQVGAPVLTAFLLYVVVGKVRARV